VWHRTGSPPRPELSAALNRPGFRVFRCESSWATLAHLCTHQGPSAPADSESTILILVQPEELPGLVDLVDAIDRFAPGATLWSYDAQHSPRMRAVSAEDLTTWKAAMLPRAPDEPPVAPVPTPPAPSAVPPLRLAGEGALPPPQPPPLTEGDPPSPHPDVKIKATTRFAGPGFLSPEPARSVTAPLLTDEELQMLLSGQAEKRT